MVISRSLACFINCPGDPHPKALEVQTPPCVDGGGDCESREDFLELRKFGKAVDENLKEPLERARKARQAFERRACDYRYAAIQDKAQELADIYGPFGPLVSGGSYLYELRRWTDAVFMLHRACLSGSGGCSSLISYLREHPEDDIGTGGVHGKAGSFLYNEMRLACEVGKSRSPVPNDSPVWCDATTGLCERKSCRKWWREVHSNKAEPPPWVDDRSDYDELKEVCSWIHSAQPKERELNQRQQALEADVERLHEQFCSPRWIEGYCSPKPKQRHGECVLETGQYCKNGLVLPDSEDDQLGSWEEKFAEKPVHIQSAPLLLAPALSLPPTSVQQRSWLAGPRPRRPRPPAKDAAARHCGFL